jgi:predicted RND superfamily exporter protein
VIFVFISYLSENKLYNMKLEAAKQLFEEIVDLCYQTENQQLIETVNQLYPEVESAQDILKVISSAEELQVNINEIEILPEEEEDVQEIQEKIEKLSE